MTDTNRKSEEVSVTKEGKKLFVEPEIKEFDDLELDVRTSTFRCGGPDPGPGETLGFKEFFLLTPLLFLMHRFGYFELHAAGCAYEDSGYLLLGASGSGKTTATLSLIASGWKYL